MASLTNTRLRKVLRRVTLPQTGWVDVFPAVIGLRDGTVLTGTAGEVWVRNILNGQKLKVYNSVAKNEPKTQVWVGRKIEEPNLWQVKGTREGFSVPAGQGLVPYHASQHVFPQPDTVFANRKQILANTVLVNDAENFIVQVYGSAALTSNGFVKIANQELDLSSYIPDVGAVYAVIEADDDGVLSVNVGDVFGAPVLGTADDVPMPEGGKYPIAIVLLFESMTELLNDHISVLSPLSANYFLKADEFIGFLVGVGTIQDAFETLDVHTHTTGFIFDDSEDPADVTQGEAEPGDDDFAARRDHIHHWDYDHVHSLERWNGASGQTVFELSEIISEIESVTLDGVEEDPILYSLSSDGTQITLDGGLPADMTVVAHYRM